MAGHSKWKNIQHRKGAQDSRRGKIFTKLIREITVAAKGSGGDPAANPRLRLAIDRALSHNMTRDTIDRAIKRGVGGDQDADLDEVRYEGYGPYGVAIMVDCMTNNRNRTVSEVRHAFSKAGGNLGSDGSVSYLFKRQGQLLFEAGKKSALAAEPLESFLMQAALEQEADDLHTLSPGVFELLCSPDQYLGLKAWVEERGCYPEQAEIVWQPTLMVTVDDAEKARSILKLIDTLEELDDVQDVICNVDIPDDLLES